MAITSNDCKLLFYAKSLNTSYEQTLTLGRLQLYAKKSDIVSCINKYKNNTKEINDVNFVDEYSEPLLEILGAKKIDSIDFSNYENASIIHDLNLPIEQKRYNQYSTIIDGGTIEHVFNFPIAIKSCMEMLKIGGHYIGITPANNQMGHGFYQFSPELYYRIFSEDNGFVIKKMLITTLNGQENSNWYEVLDPKKVNSRVMLSNDQPISLMIIAEKVKSVTIFEKIPQQNDYQNTWDAHKSLSSNQKPENVSLLKYIYRKFLPKKIKNITKNIYNICKTEEVQTSDLGKINPDHFKKIDI